MLENKDIFYLKRCFQLAQIGIGKVSPNPAVGAVIVHDDKIIGEGFHEYFGGAHAEVVAVNNVSEKNKALLPYSTIYVNLEPCFHYGKTPPCVDLILREKIQRVVIAVPDPNPKVGGKSIEKLKAASVQVDIMQSHDWTTEMLNLKRATLSPFLTNIQKDRPYIILKWAQTPDGIIGRHNARINISNESTQRLVHKWRSESDAVIVGTQTIVTDNPNLDNRFYFGKSPIRITFDKTQHLPFNLNIFNKKQETIVFTANENAPEPFFFLKNYGKEEALKDILNSLSAKNVGIIFIEGGATLLNSFISAGLWDEARIITGKENLFSGIQAPRLNKGFLMKTENFTGDEIKYWSRDAF